MPNKTPYLTRQPIADAKETLFGYELLYSGTKPSLQPSSSSNINDSARLLVSLLEHFNFDEISPDKPVFIPVAADLLSIVAQAIPRKRLILEIGLDKTPADDPLLLEHCRHLKSQGYLLAITEPAPEKQWSDLLKITDFVNMNSGEKSGEELKSTFSGIKHLPVKFIAKNIRNRKTFLQCKKNEFNYFSGNYFVEPETLDAITVEPFIVETMRVFQMVVNRADLRKIDEAIKHNPALCYQLIRLVNSPYYGLTKKATSVFEAINVLGYNGLWRWLAVLIFAGCSPDADQRVLLNVAMIRGRLTELLGQLVLPADASDELFIVGIFSLLDVLLNMPLEKALKYLSLSENVIEALLHRTGKYAPYLNLALSFENYNATRALELAGELRMDLTLATQAHMEALRWSRLLLV